MVTQRRGHPDSRSMVRYPDPRLNPLRLEQLRRMRNGPPPSPEGIGKKRLALAVAAWLLFLTGLFFVFF